MNFGKPVSGCFGNLENPSALDLTDHPDVQVRRRALLLLDLFRDHSEQIIAPLVATLKNREVAVAAMAVLEGIGSPATPALVEAVVAGDDDRELTIANDMLHHNVDYTPYEGIEIKGWPAIVLSRGEVVCESGEVVGAQGRGEFLPCAQPDAAKPLGRQVTDFQPA